VAQKAAAVEPAQPLQFEYRTARTRAAIPATTVAVGDKLNTASGERRRVTLPDTSLLYLNENTNVAVDAPRHLTLNAGELYVEVAPHAGEAAKFTVQTPQREVTALGTKFDVQSHGEVT